jgi:hypothetical protein
VLLRSAIVVLVILSVVAPGAIPAQAAPRWGLDGSIGPSQGLGGAGIYNDRSSIAVDALVAFRLQHSVGYSPIGALSAGYLAIPGGDDASCEPRPDGGCFEQFPAFSYHAWLVGLEWLHRRGASVRILAGGVRVRGGFDYSEANGVQTRLEVGPFPIESMSPILGMRFTHVRDYLDRALSVWSVGIGLRLR